MKFIAYILTFSLALSFVALPLGVLAALPIAGTSVSPVTNAEDLVGTIESIVSWVFTILIIAAVFMVLIAAFQFVTAGGSADTISSARQKLLMAVVGILLAFFAQAIPIVLKNILISSVPPAAEEEESE
ncbi:hypothetical protein KKI17_00005 [Patescibacteria group bacterium]|nr:hypothetical protein [Patescibacteria group bacterium]